MKQRVSKVERRTKGTSTTNVALSFTLALSLAAGTVPTQALAQMADEAIAVEQSNVQTAQNALVVEDDVSGAPLSVTATDQSEPADASDVQHQEQGIELIDKPDVTVETDDSIAAEPLLSTQDAVEDLGDGQYKFTNDDGEYTFVLDVDNNATITHYEGTATTLAIPQFVGEYLVVKIDIGKTSRGAFESNATLESVVIPNTVTEIGRYAFKKCTNLGEVRLSEALKRINTSAFESCSSLKTVVIPEGTTTVGDSAFSKCSALAQVVLPATLTQIGTSSFNSCSALTQILIPESVTSIGNTAFASCGSLTNVSFFTPGSTKEPAIRTLGSSVFSGCVGLTSITIPASLESCGTSKGPFVGCVNLKRVYFEKGTTTVASGLLADCPGITSITVPEGITKVGNSAFKNCTALTQANLPYSLTVIDSSAFQSCTALPSIVLPEALQKIADSVFKGCTAMSRISFPQSLTDIGSSAFEGSGLESVTIPSNVIRLGASAFKSCVTLRKAEILDGITQLGDSTFMGCERLSELTLPSSLTSIGAKAFRDCDSLRSFQVPQNVKTLGNEVFYDCDGLVVFAMPNTVTSMGRSIFYDCDALVDVSLGSGIKEIPATTFRHCDELSSIAIPRSVATIGTDAFVECTNLTSVYTTDAITSIASGAFSYPKRMTMYGVEGSYAETFANEKGIRFQPLNVEATLIELLPSELTLKKGERLQIRTNIEPINYTGSITWESSDPLVASVSETGMVQAVGPGSATVKINVGSKYATLEVTVTQPVTSVSLNSRSLQLEGGQAYQLVEKVSPDDASDKEVVWSSSNEAVATVSPTGRVRGLRKGSTTITCMAADGTERKATCAVTVTSDVLVATNVSQLESAHPAASATTSSWLYTLAGASSLSVTFDARTSMEADTDRLTILDDGDREVGTFTGTDLAGKTVDVPGDTVRIRLSTGESSTAWGFKVNAVTQSGAVSSVKLNNNALLLLLGSTSTLVPTCNPAEAASRVVWKSSDERIATVSAQGVVTAVKAGTATITASVGSKFDACEVTVIAPVAISGASVASIPSVYCTGEAITPEPVVTYKDATLVEGVDYTLTYENNVNAGTARIILTGRGFYAGTKTVTFRIMEKKANTLSARANSRAIQCIYNAAQATVTDPNVTVSNAIGAVSFSNASTDMTAKTFEVGSASGAVTIPKGTMPGVYAVVVQVDAAGDDTYKEKSVAVPYTITVTKLANTMSAVAKKGTVSCTFNPSGATTTSANVAVSNPQGSVSYTNASTNSVARRFQVDASTGKVVVPQNTAVGVYPVVVKATAAGNDYYEAGSATATYNVSVKKRTNTLAVKVGLSSVSYPYRETAATEIGSNISVSGAQGTVTYTNVSSKATPKKFIVNATSGRVSVPKGTKAGTYTVKIQVRAAGNGNYKARSITVGYKVSITKIANPMTVRASYTAVSLSSVAKKAQVVAPITVSNAKGKVTYKKSSGSAALVVNAKTGKVTVKKGTKGGTYSASILVTAAGNANYKALKRSVSVQVVVR